MKNILLLSTLFILQLSTFSQVPVTFQINLYELTKDGLFSPEDGDKVYVQGSFNQWKGTANELMKSSQQGIYQGTFDLTEKPGDTISYKFVIERSQGHFFWERNPDPSNPDSENRQFIMGKEKLILPVAHFRYDEYFQKA